MSNINLQKEIAELQTTVQGLVAERDAAQERIHQFDQCIRAVAEALNAPACGGVDTDIDDPYGTTAVLVGRAKELVDRVRKAEKCPVCGNRDALASAIPVDIKGCSVQCGDAITRNDFINKDDEFPTC